MKKSLRKPACRRMTWMLLGFFALWRTEPMVASQDGGAKDSCGVIHDSYQATFAAGAQISIQNAGAINVTQAQAAITSDASYHESCKYIRDETIAGETASLYSDIMKSPAGLADGKVWISKKTRLVLQQEVDVDLGAKGKGHQTMKFNYKKK